LLSAAIGGPAGELLEQNARFFEQITANFSSFQVNILASALQMYLVYKLEQIAAIFSSFQVKIFWLLC